MLERALEVARAEAGVGCSWRAVGLLGFSSCLLGQDAERLGEGCAAFDHQSIRAIRSMTMVRCNAMAMTDVRGSGAAARALPHRCCRLQGGSDSTSEGAPQRDGADGREGGMQGARDARRPRRWHDGGDGGEGRAALTADGHAERRYMEREQVDGAAVLGGAARSEAQASRCQGRWSAQPSVRARQMCVSRRCCERRWAAGPHACWIRRTSNR